MGRGVDSRGCLIWGLPWRRRFGFVRLAGKADDVEEVSTLTHRLGLPHAAAKFFGCLRKTKTKTENRKLSTRTVDAFVSLSRVSCVISVSNLQLN